MPFARPTLSDLRQQGRANLVAALGLLVPALQRWLAGILSDLSAAMVSGEYGYLTWQARQLFVSSADSEYIDRAGNELGIYRKPAAPAAGNVVFAGATTTPVPSGTPLANADLAQSYTVQTTGTIGVGGTVSLPVLAVTPGSAGNQPAGASLTISTAVAGVQAQTTIDVGGLTGGVDVESDALYRGRVLQRKQQPPQGGCRTDYIAWAKLVPACTRAWSFPRNRGGGTVDVTFVCDGRANIIPLAADIGAVQDAIAPLQPGQVDCAVFACTPDPIAVTIANLSPNTAASQAAIVTALGGLFATTTPGQALYGDGVSAAAPGGILLLEQIATAIAGVAGVTGFDLVSPSGDIASAFGHIAVLGAVTAT